MKEHRLGRPPKNDRPESRDCAAQARMLDILRLLMTDVIHGVSNADIVRHTGVSPATVTRDMQTLANKGYASQTSAGLWRPSTLFVSFGVAVQQQLIEEKSRLDELSHNLLASAAAL